MKNKNVLWANAVYHDNIMYVAAGSCRYTCKLGNNSCFICQQNDIMPTLNETEIVSSLSVGASKESHAFSCTR